MSVQQLKVGKDEKKMRKKENLIQEIESAKNISDIKEILKKVVRQQD